MPFPGGFPATRDAFLATPNVRSTRFFKAYVNPQTLDEVEWRIEMKFAHCLPSTVIGFQAARNKINDLLFEGYIEVGVINLSIMGTLYDVLIKQNPLRVELKALRKDDYKIASYYFDDDDRRGHVFAQDAIARKLLAR